MNQPGTIYNHLQLFDLAEKQVSAHHKGLLELSKWLNTVSISFSLKNLSKKSRGLFICGSLFFEYWSGGDIRKIRRIRLKRKGNKTIRYNLILTLSTRTNIGFSLRNLIHKLRRTRHLMFSRADCRYSDIDKSSYRNRGIYTVSFKKLLHAIDFSDKDLPFYRYFENQVYNYTLTIGKSTAPFVDNLLLSYQQYPIL